MILSSDVVNGCMSDCACDKSLVVEICEATDVILNITSFRLGENSPLQWSALGWQTHRLVLLTLLLPLTPKDKITQKLSMHPREQRKTDVSFRQSNSQQSGNMLDSTRAQMWALVPKLS